MKKFITLIFLVVCGFGSQAHYNLTTQEPILYKVDKYPQYAGGFEAFITYLKKNLHTGTEKGRVIATFVVEKDGSITGIKIVRSFSEEAEAEALRVIKLMPKWSPGMDKGKTVRVQYTIPISFPTL
ncbi:energy transducer TonB [Mucilaginibacter sp. UYCu711]|uniref:energy transducer TonB n=1 Tax=Mucilaginibacter sp. UYCu711 TaxID=3156339 RepID=UPI003D1D0873